MVKALPPGIGVEAKAAKPAVKPPPVGFQQDPLFSVPFDNKAPPQAKKTLDIVRPRRDSSRDSSGDPSGDPSRDPQ